MPDASEKQVLQPGPDHPISVEPDTGTVTVSVEGLRIAETKRALILREATYPPVYYIPLEDVEPSQLVATDNSSYCPFKGDANYYSVPAGGERSVNAVWEYRDPFPAVAQIAAHVAFFADKVEIERVSSDRT